MEKLNFQIKKKSFRTPCFKFIEKLDPKIIILGNTVKIHLKSLPFSDRQPPSPSPKYIPDKKIFKRMYLLLQHGGQANVDT